MPTLLALVAWAPRASASSPDIVMWGHPGCPHCREAHAYLDGLRARRPDLVIVEHDVSKDADAFEDLRIEEPKRAGLKSWGYPASGARHVHRGLRLGGRHRTCDRGAAPARRASGPRGSRHDDEVEVPWLGRLSARRLGLPLFTVAIGLIDGFNPCAMWVLMFLLALLVNVKGRARMLAIAGTFVVVSGLAYYTFMAAWLSVFQLLGISRAVQIVLGSFALIVGAVNVKDFVAYGKGISLSIPESAKPGIYARVRAIVHAENLPAAMLGVTVLAILVNVIELSLHRRPPCPLHPGARTAGGRDRGPLCLPRPLQPGVHARRFDHGRHRGRDVGSPQAPERAGRWLKLLSGLTIVILGLLLILWPRALVW